MSDVESVSSDTAKLLKDVTGETRLDSAVRIIIDDALKHRLEKIDNEIQEFKEKHDKNFKEFEQAWENDKIENKYSYNIEKDYWIWEGLITKKDKMEQALEQLEDH